MGDKDPAKMKRYLLQLARDVKRGLATDQDLMNAKRLFSGKLTLEDITGTMLEEDPSSELILPKVSALDYSVIPSSRESQEETRLSRDYFLELYGDFHGHRSDDHSEFLLGTYRGVKAGGAWFFNLPEG